ncbi:MAG: hypothetical protein Q7T87_01210 [Polaromonas sp.]|nr:hypothetical protein [Polaromonas sp.]
MAAWRKRLADTGRSELLARLPDLDTASLVDSLPDQQRSEARDRSNAQFFDNYVHDSMASFIDMHVDEMDFPGIGNGYGLFKWRRIFFGDREDAFLRDQVKAENQRRTEADAARRAGEKWMRAQPLS